MIKFSSPLLLRESGTTIPCSRRDRQPGSACGGETWRYPVIFGRLSVDSLRFGELVIHSGLDHRLHVLWPGVVGDAATRAEDEAAALANLVDQALAISFHLL